MILREFYDQTSRKEYKCNVCRKKINKCDNTYNENIKTPHQLHKFESSFLHIDPIQFNASCYFGGVSNQTPNH